MPSISSPLFPAGVVGLVAAGLIAAPPVAPANASSYPPAIQLTSATDVLLGWPENVGFPEYLQQGYDEAFDPSTDIANPDLNTDGYYDPFSEILGSDDIFGSDSPFDDPSLDIATMLNYMFGLFGPFGPMLSFIFTGPLGIFFQPLLLDLLPLAMPFMLPMMLGGFLNGLSAALDGQGSPPDMLDTFSPTGLDTVAGLDMLGDPTGDVLTGTPDLSALALPDLLSVF